MEPGPIPYQSYRGPQGEPVSGVHPNGSGIPVGQRYLLPQNRALYCAGMAVALIIGIFLTGVLARESASAYRLLSGQVWQFIGAKRYTDSDAGLVVPVPDGWEVKPGGAIWGSTVIVPAGTTSESTDTQKLGLVVLGAINRSFFVPEQSDNRRAAMELASDMGEFFVPVSGTREEQRLDKVRSRAGAGWSYSYRVVPEPSAGMFGPGGSSASEGGLVYSAVLGEGADRWFLTYIGQPGDGSPTSPGTDWVDFLVSTIRRV